MKQRSIIALTMLFLLAGCTETAAPSAESSASSFSAAAIESEVIYDDMHIESCDGYTFLAFRTPDDEQAAAAGIQRINGIPSSISSRKRTIRTEHL